MDQWKISRLFWFLGITDVIKPILALLFFELCYLKTLLVDQILLHGDEEISMQHGLRVLAGEHRCILIQCHPPQSESHTDWPEVVRGLSSEKPATNCCALGTAP